MAMAEEKKNFEKQVLEGIAQISIRKIRTRVGV
jgi:hypothetical protein